MIDQELTDALQQHSVARARLRNARNALTTAESDLELATVMLIALAYNTKATVINNVVAEHAFPDESSVYCRDPFCNAPIQRVGTNWVHQNRGPFAHEAVGPE